MSIKSHLKERGIPTLDGQASLFYQIGTAAITLAILCLLSRLSVAFGSQFSFSFSWILSIVLIVLFICQGTNILLLIATAFVLVILTLISLLIGGPFSSIFGVIVFLVLIIGGWFLQHHACNMQKDQASSEKEWKGLIFSPLSYTAYILEKLKFIDADKE